MIENEFWNKVGIRPEKLPDWKVVEKLQDGRFGIAHYSSNGEKTMYWGTIEQCSVSLGALAKYR